GIEFFEAAWAAWKLGATPQPVSMRLPEMERAAIIELAQPALVVGVAPDEAGGRVCVSEGFIPPVGTSAEPLAPAVAAAWKAPTSGGSTGRPKLIVAGEPADAAIVGASARRYHAGENGVQLITGPLYHNAPFSVGNSGILLGNTQVVMTRFDAETSLRLIEENAVDWMYAVPTMMHRIWRLPAEVRARYNLSSLRVVFHMAAPCPEWLKRAWIDWLGPERVYELYGGTEAQAICVISGVEWLEHLGSVGRPVVGEMVILDVDGNVVSHGEVGEIWLRRDREGRSPYRYVGATPRRLGTWESLGDMGRMDVDGYVYVTDRNADMILVGGANVYPAEVEAAIDAHPSVASSCVIGLPDEDLGSVPHAIVQLHADLTETELLEHLGIRLARYKLPRSFEWVTEPLRDDAGKVRRAALRAERVARLAGIAGERPGPAGFAPISDRE
ncbi:MAG TPA: AMP-binding protein, partial [Acidimicrobiales bacterium]|nr:AMP-binding protein [Acidimicrobiales bacterium]